MNGDLKNKHKRNINSSVQTYCVLIFLILLGCDSNYNINNSFSRSSLISTVQEYYSLEKKELWDKTYEFRLPIFKESVTKDFYISNMREDNQGWHLVEYKILSVMKNKDEAIVKIRFKEESPSQAVILGKKARYVVLSEDTKWKNIKDKWFCVYCGTRTHLSLNSELAKE